METPANCNCTSASPCLTPWRQLGHVTCSWRGHGRLCAGLTVTLAVCWQSNSEKPQGQDGERPAAGQQGRSGNVVPLCLGTEQPCLVWVSELYPLFRNTAQSHKILRPVGTLNCLGLDYQWELWTRADLLSYVPHRNVTRLLWLWRQAKIFPIAFTSDLNFWLPFVCAEFQLLKTGRKVIVGKKNKLTALLTLLAPVHLFIISHFLIVEGFGTNSEKPPALTRHALTLSLISVEKGH